MTLVRYSLGGVGKGGNYITVNLIEDCDIRCDIRNVDRYMKRDGVVDEILLSHTLEHIAPQDFVQFVFDLRRKLKCGGKLRIVQTDGGEVIRQWIDGVLSFRAMRATLFPPPDRLMKNPLNRHMQMWNEEELVKELERLGFSVDTFDSGSWPLDIVDELFPEETEPYRGTPIKNLGIIATKLSIPKIIHQTWKSAQIPEELFPLEWIESWKNLDGYAYNLWTDGDNRQLIREHFEWFLPTYDAYDVPIKRADAARYFILSRYGGIYADLDFHRLRRLEPLLSGNDLVLCHQSPGCVGNAFMGSSPEHPVFLEAITKLKANAGRHVLQATGPEYLTRIIEDSYHVEEILPTELVYPYRWNDPRKSEYAAMTAEELREVFPSSIAVTHWTGSWIRG